MYVCWNRNKAIGDCRLKFCLKNSIREAREKRLIKKKRKRPDRQEQRAERSGVYRSSHGGDGCKVPADASLAWKMDWKRLEGHTSQCLGVYI